MMPLKPLLKNKLLLQKHFNVNEFCLDGWPYWMLEENIKIVNEINKEEEEKQGGDKGSANNFNPSSYMKNMESMANKFKK